MGLKEPRDYWDQYSTWATNDLLRYADQTQAALKADVEFCSHLSNAPYHIARSLMDKKDRKAQDLEDWVAKMQRFITEADAAIESLTEKSCNDELEYDAYKALLDEREKHEKARSLLRAKVNLTKAFLKQARAQTAPSS